MAIWSKKCLFCIKKYPIRICIMLLLFISCMFVPLFYTILIYSSPLVGFSFLVHRIFLGIDRRKVKKRVQPDDKRKKFAKSCRSFKSKYGDRSHLSRRNRKDESGNYTDTDVDDKDDIFSKSLNDLLADNTFLFAEKPKEIGEMNVESLFRRAESSSSSNNIYGKYRNVNDDYKDERGSVSADEYDKQQNKGVRWIEDDQKNVMDLGLLETERNKRLEGLMQRRRSRKKLNFLDKEEEETGINHNSPISAIKVVKINPFLEVKSCGKETPGSAPSLSVIRNPFDLPYDPHEEKLDLSGDDFHEEFTVAHHKEPVFCRHQSFRLGAFSHPDITHDKNDISFYKDLATKQKTFGNRGDDKHIEQDSPVSDDSISSTDDHLKEEVESSEQGVGQEERKSKEVMLDERKADIVFFYGGQKRVGGHKSSNSILSDMQVEVSDEEPSLNDLDVHKEKGSWLSLSSLSEVDSKPDGEEDDTKPLSHDLPSSSSTQEMDNKPQPLNSDTAESNLANEVQQSDNHTRESENGFHQNRNS